MPTRTCSESDTTVRPRQPMLVLDVAMALAAERFERACGAGVGQAAAAAMLEREVAQHLVLDRVLYLWIDWAHREVLIPNAAVSPRVAELALEAAGTGKHVVVENAIVQPIGRTPARAVLVAKGRPEHLFQPHALRTLRRLAARLGPSVDRIGAG